MEPVLSVSYPPPSVCLIGLLKENSRQGFRLAGSTVHQGFGAGKYLIGVGDTAGVVRDAWLESLKAVKAAILTSMKASNAPAPAAGDTKGGFHEESGLAGTDANGKLVISPDKPGPYANPDTTTEAHTSGQPVNQNVRNSITDVTVAWHVHPSGRTATHEWIQPPSAADRAGAIPGAINIVVGARNKTVYFYGPTGPVVHMKLKDFTGGP